MKVNGASILSRKATIDAGEKTTVTAETKAQVVVKPLPDDSEITIDFEAVGNGVKGVKLILYYKKN